MGSRVMRVAPLVLALSVSCCYSCEVDEDCNLNGVCGSNRHCDCDPAWTGADCGILNVVGSSARRIYPGDDTVSSWGGRPVWDPQTQLYHLFVAEFANGCTLGQWSPNSQVIRATSESVWGPYVKQELVLPPFHHNPTITRANDGTWLLYTIGHDVAPQTVQNCSDTLKDPAPGNMESNITLHASQSVLGPWKRVGVVLAGDDGPEWDADRTNPSAYANADGTIHLMYRGCGVACGGGEYMGLAIAPHWNCSVDVVDGCRYERQSVGSPLWGLMAEDPFIFKDRRGGWHAVMHSIEPNGGFGCNNVTWRHCDVGGHAFSHDGLRWTLSDTTPFTTNVTWVDGAAETLNRRERPQLVIAADGVTLLALVTGVQKSNVPPSCSQGGTVQSKECLSFTLAVALSTPVDQLFV